MATMTSQFRSPKIEQWSISVPLGKDFAPEDIIIKAVNNDLEIIAEKWSSNGKALLANFNHKYVRINIIALFLHFK